MTPNLRRLLCLALAVSAAGTTASIEVDARGAQHPLLAPVFETAILSPDVLASDPDNRGPIAIDGDVIVVGEPDEVAFQDGPSTGAAYVYVKPATGWADATAENARLVRPDTVTYPTRVGESVAISGDTIVIGATSTGHVPGAAYVYRKPAGGWAGTLFPDAVLHARHAPADQGDGFGFSADIKGSRIVVVAQRNFNPGARRKFGVAYVFHEPPGGWHGEQVETGALDLPEEITGYRASAFGWDVASAGRTIVVASFGAAFIYEPPAGRGWRGHHLPLATLSIPPQGDVGSLYSIAIAHDTIALGLAYSGTGTGRGAACIFVKPPGGWTDALTTDATARLVAPGDDEAPDFGAAVAIPAADRILVSRPSDNVADLSHPVYFFKRPATGWAGEVQASRQIRPADMSAIGGFGYFLDVSRGVTVASARLPNLSGSGPWRRVAYVFDRSQIVPWLGVEPTRPLRATGF